MKIAIITDTHFDVRNSSPLFANHIDRFFRDVFFPYLASHKDITHVLHCGDVFDKRKNVSVLVASQFRTGVIEPIVNLGLSATFLVGNHDAFFRHTNTPNSVYELVGDRYPNIDVVSSPCTKEINGVPIDLYPWITEENEVASQALMESSPAQIAFGHFEWAGYLMFPGQYMEGGRSFSEMDRYKFVKSGHYHEKNGPYLGTAYDLTWADYGSKKGFHVFDPKTFSLEFIENPRNIFCKIMYTDATPISKKSAIEGKIVKLFVVTKSDNNRYEQFLHALRECSPHSLQVIDSTNLGTNISLTGTPEKDSAINEGDTLSLLMEYCDIDDEEKKHQLKRFLVDLHYRALSISSAE